MKKNEPNENNQRGCIVMVSSISGDGGISGSIPYTASKSALNGIVLPMARDLGFLGIRAMTIAPSGIPTPMVDGYLTHLGVPLEGHQAVLDMVSK
jgi:NAD(P)-dependent dehydrogenase (short-subunit alcohol dehydrogenase family)